MTVDQTAPSSAWPEGVVARYLTLVGATVDVRANGPHSRFECTGCPIDSGPWPHNMAHERAQAHAEKCRALPRPEVGE
ncbi:hypothetical protein [Streptomyces griseosporeus]